MLGTFKRRRLFKKLNQLCEAHQPQGVRELNRIGFIVDLKLLNRPDYKESLMKAFGVKEEETEIIVLPLLKNAKSEPGGDRIFTTKQISVGGNVKAGSDAEDFLSDSFDLLVSYYVHTPPEVLLLSAAAKAKLKVGFAAEENFVNDLSVDINPEDVVEFAKEVKKYLPKLN